MTTLAFDTLRYARRLKEAGVPEPQAEVQAELMAEAFGFYADNLLTKDHFTEVLNARFAELGARLGKGFAEHDAKMEKRFAEQDAKMEKRFAEQDARFEQRFGAIDQRFSEQDARFEQRFVAIDQRFAKQNERLRLHGFILGLILVAVVVPQLQAWLG